ncbi:MAG: DMT family transporter [Thermoleophilaceae bacterium]|nr:DMT family transporter [Thermoleophilaceae bacterium]
MNRRTWTLLLFLAALWGASYMFIKVGLRDLSPGMVVFARTALAALLLVPWALRRGAFEGLRPLLGSIALLAAVQVAAPFALISIGEEHIDSSLAGILVAAAPIFTALLASSVAAEETLTPKRIAGIGVGILGVALLLGVDVGGGTALVGGLLVVLASLGYAIGALFMRSRLNGPDPLGTAALAMVFSALFTLPWAAIDPGDAPGLAPLLSVLALGFAGTGLAFAIYHTLIRDAGAVNTSLVAYLSPGFSVFYGALILDERIGPGAIGGLVLILAGSWLAASDPARERAAVPLDAQ